MTIGPIIASVLMAAVWAMTPQAQTQVADTSVKAAFLVRFPDFVTWPDESSTTGFTVCLSPSHPFGEAVGALATGAVVRGRPMRVRQVRAADSITDCQVLYVAPGDEHLLSPARLGSVLTVGEGPEFCPRGGVLALRVIGDRVRFEVHLSHAKTAGLSIDSQLLRLAMAVHGGRQ